MTTPPKDAPPAPPSAAAKLIKLGSMAARLVVMGLVLYLGWGAYLGFRDMMADPGPKVSEEIDLDEAALLVPAELLLNQSETGPWLMAGLPFQMESSEVAEADLASTLLAPIRNEGEAPAWPLDDGLKHLLTLMTPEPRKDKKGSIYRMDSPEQRIAIQSVRKDGKEALIGGRLARRGPGGKWSVVEVTAGERIFDNVLNQGLLPLPLGSRVLAQRRTLKDQPLAELALLPSSMAAAKAFWRAQGWTTRPIKGWDEGKLLVCFKDGVSISAWAMPGERAEDPTAVLLVRLPESRDRSASKGE